MELEAKPISPTLLWEKIFQGADAPSDSSERLEGSPEAAESATAVLMDELTALQSMDGDTERVRIFFAI